MCNIEKQNFKKIKKFIKKFVKKNNDEFVPNWSDNKQQKFFISFCYDESKFYTDYSFTKKIIGIKYMSKENAEKLISILNAEQK